MPKVSDDTVVPGNQRLTKADIRARQTEILMPYQARIEQTLRDRAARGQPTALFAMHSCTHQLRSNPTPRPWPIYVIAHSDWRIGTALIDILRAETDLKVGVNEPDTVNRDMGYTIPVHAEATG